MIITSTLHYIVLWIIGLIFVFSVTISVIRLSYSSYDFFTLLCSDLFSLLTFHLHFCAAYQVTNVWISGWSPFCRCTRSSFSCVGVFHFCDCHDLPVHEQSRTPPVPRILLELFMRANLLLQSRNSNALTPLTEILDHIRSSDRTLVTVITISIH